MKDLKRLGRYRLCWEIMVITHNRHSGANVVGAWTDTDYACCADTRTYTSGGLIMIGQHALESWSNTQAVVALSSGEAEYDGAVRETSIGIGVRGCMEDLGLGFRIRTSTDSPVAMGNLRGED